MYIPTWILIIFILGGIFYYFSKRKSSSSKISMNAENQSKGKDWLDDENWKDIMLMQLAKFPKRTGKKMPTYDEMLDLDEDEFKAWLFVRAEADNQEELLEEMIEHEEKTGSFEKTSKPSDSKFTKLILDVFKRDRSKEVVDVLRRLSDTANEFGYEDEHGGKGDVVKNAVWAKGTSDYYKLGEKMENERASG